jgi:hypothetical protein
VSVFTLAKGNGRPLNRMILAIGGIVSDADSRRLAMPDDCD